MPQPKRTTAKPSRAAAFRPTDTPHTLPSGVDVVVTSRPPSMLALVNDGILPREAVFGTELQALDAILEHAPHVLNAVLVDPKIHVPADGEDPNDVPADKILFRWLSQDDVDDLIDLVTGSDQEDEQDADSFRRDSDGGTGGDGSEAVGDNPQSAAA